jgi:CO dehydrogenase/acetyl-CoA synthase complex epsilon subunit
MKEKVEGEDLVTTFTQTMLSANNPMIMLGAMSSVDVMEYAMELSDALDAHIAATGNSVKYLREKGYEKCSKEYVWNVINYVLLPEWKEGWRGVGGKGRPDLMVFMGYDTFFLQRALSTLKYFSQCKTLTLENKFFADASLSWDEMAEEEWKEGLKKVLNGIESKIKK